MAGGSCWIILPHSAWISVKSGYVNNSKPSCYKQISISSWISSKIYFDFKFIRNVNISINLSTNNLKYYIWNMLAIYPMTTIGSNVSCLMTDWHSYRYQYSYTSPRLRSFIKNGGPLWRRNNHAIDTSFDEWVWNDERTRVGSIWIVEV